MSESPILVDSGVPDDDGVKFDPTFAKPSPTDRAGQSAMDALRTALTQDVENEPITLPVPKRRGVTIRYATNLTQDQIKAWRRRSVDRTRRARPGEEPEVDEMAFACLVLANQAECIIFNGVDAHDSDDMPLNFKSPDILAMYGASTAAETVRALYANDAHVLTTAGKVTLAAGYADDVEDEDPTTAS